MCATNWTPSFSACGSLMALLHHNPAVGGGSGGGGGGDSPPPAGASPTRPGPTPSQSQTARRPSSRSPTTPSAHQQQPSLQARNESPHLSSPGPPSTLAGINGASNSGAGALGLQQTANPAVAAPVVTVMALQTSASASAAGTAGPSTVTCSLALMRSCSPPARGAGGAAASACSIASHHRFSTSASSAPMDTGDVRELRVPAYLEHCVLRVYISSLDFLRTSIAFINLFYCTLKHCIYQLMQFSSSKHFLRSERKRMNS